MNFFETERSAYLHKKTICMIPKTLKKELQKSPIIISIVLICMWYSAIFCFLYLSAPVVIGVWNEYQLSGNNSKGIAVVTQKNEHNEGRGNYSFTIEYKFNAHNASDKYITAPNHEHTNKSVVSQLSYENININDNVKIIYNPKNPNYSKMEIQHFLNMTRKNTVYGFLCLIASIGIFVTILYERFIQKQKI